MRELVGRAPAAADDEPAPVPIVALGMTDQARGALGLLLERPEHPTTFVLADDRPDVELALIDLDGVGAHQLLVDHHRDHPNRLLVGLSLHDRDYPELDALVSKPVRGEELVATLVALQRPTDTTEPGPPPPPFVRSRPAQRSTRRAAATMVRRVDLGASSDHPEVGRAGGYVGSLLALLGETVEVSRAKARRMVLVHPSGTIVVDGQAATATSALPMRQLRTLARFTDARTQWTRRAARRRSSGDAGPTYPLEVVQWALGVWTFGTGLPPRTTTTERYVLRRWPDLPRLVPVPDAARLAAVWVQTPRSIDEVVEETGSLRTHVNTFFSAAWAAGLVAGEEAASPVRLEAPRRPVSRRLLGSVLARLRESAA